jgi:anti-sigma B factor antagonist
VSDDTQRLSIERTAVDGDIVLVLDGEIDPHTAPQLESELEQALAAESARLVLDLEQVRFIDSSGLRVFITAHREMNDRGGKLLLRSPNDTAVRLLEITGLDAHIDVES